MRLGVVTTLIRASVTSRSRDDEETDLGRSFLVFLGRLVEPILGIRSSSLVS